MISLLSICTTIHAAENKLEDQLMPFIEQHDPKIWATIAGYVRGSEISPITSFDFSPSEYKDVEILHVSGGSKTWSDEEQNQYLPKFMQKLMRQNPSKSLVINIDPGFKIIAQEQGNGVQEDILLRSLSLASRHLGSLPSVFIAKELNHRGDLYQTLLRSTEDVLKKNGVVCLADMASGEIQGIAELYNQLCTSYPQQLILVQHHPGYHDKTEQKRILKKFGINNPSPSDIKVIDTSTTVLWNNGFYYVNRDHQVGIDRLHNSLSQSQEDEGIQKAKASSPKNLPLRFVPAGIAGLEITLENGKFPQNIPGTDAILDVA